MNYTANETGKFTNICQPTKLHACRKRNKRKHNEIANTYPLICANESYEQPEPIYDSTNFTNLEYNLTSIDYMCDLNDTKQFSNGDKKLCEKPKLISINEAFEILRSHIPTFPYERRLSKIDTLHLAISYIYLLQSVIESKMSFYEYLQSSINSSIVNKTQVTPYNKPKWETSGKYKR
jgi:hypothetical protein